MKCKHQCVHPVQSCGDEGMSWWDGTANPCDSDYRSACVAGVVKKDFNYPILADLQRYDSLTKKHIPQIGQA
jgi:hypothetical protein